MTTSVPNRRAIRQALAALLETALVGTSKPAQVVYRFKKSDFQGQSPVVCVASDAAVRSKQAQPTRVSSIVELKVHTFVRYMSDPVMASNSPAAGASKTLNITDTSGFAIGANAVVEDSGHYEVAAVTAITPNVSVTVASLANAYTTPKVYWLNEELSEDLMDLIEKTISDTLMDNQTTANWGDLDFGGPTEMDPVAIGGREYNHEIISVQIQAFSE